MVTGSVVALLFFGNFVIQSKQIKMKIAIINTTYQKYGGSIYTEMIFKALSKDFKSEFINTGVRTKSILKYLEAPLVLWRIFEFSKRKNIAIAIKNFEASIFLNQKPAKNIAVVYHIDNSSRPFFLKPFFFMLEKIVFANLKKFDKIVVISSYWEDFFRGKGFKNLTKIYCAFDVEEFDFSKEEIESFKKRHHLTGKPIIYIGNCTKGKGVVESYAALKDLDVYLVTSGKKRVNLPVTNLELDRKDYLRLLKSSSVVITMSKFKEGWNMTAHEAMLCKTPVIGSGLGGMRELLEGGGQVICENFLHLQEKVKYCLAHPEFGARGYNYAKNFIAERFKKQWMDLINSSD